MITNKQRDILNHTMHGAAGGFYCGDSPEMEGLVVLGLMQSAGRKSFVPDEYFRITSAGMKALNEWNTAQPKPALKKRKTSRAWDAWRSWVNAGSYLSFSQFYREEWPHLNH